MWTAWEAPPLVPCSYRGLSVFIMADWTNISWADKGVNGGHCASIQDGRRHSPNIKQEKGYA